MIGLIYSQSSNGYIGKDGKLLFSIPEDMKRFKEITLDKTVIMGRKTWESLPDKFKPLPKRTNIVISSNPEFRNSINSKYESTMAVRSLPDALELCIRHREIWIIGGESLYKEGILYADIIEQTFITKEFEGDAKAPVIDLANWKPDVGRHFKEHDGLYYQFNTYRRIKS